MSRPRILIVDDEALIAEDLQITLENMGCEVVGIAASGMEAVGKAACTNPDVVLMDVRLQGRMTGLEAARVIQSHADVAVIYVSAHVAVLDSVEAGSRSSSLAKPFTPQQIRTAIESVLERAEKAGQNQARASS